MTRARMNRRVRAAAKKVVQRKSKRPAVELLADLKAQRERVVQQMDRRLTKLDSEIDRVSTRYEKSIKLHALTTEKSVEELQRELQQTKQQERLLRMALKQK